MDDENSVNRENNIDITTPTEKQYLIEFFKTRKIYPELWNTSIQAYRDKIKKNSVLKKLLDVYIFFIIHPLWVKLALRCMPHPT